MIDIISKNYFDYLVYEDGRVYSFKTNKFLIGEITKHGYLQYTLSINGVLCRTKCHRLVAQLFLDEPNEDFNIVNHKDGNKLNNHYTNLEWCNYYYNNKHARDTGLNNVSHSNSKRWEDKEFRKRTSEKISKTLIQNKVNSGINNPKFRYLILCNDEMISREQLSTMIGKSQSYTDVLIRKSASGNKIDIFEKFKIRIVDTKKS